jgi:threonine synthase
VRYISTRGKAPALSFDDVLLAGLARDGGLYVPEEWPFFTAQDLRELTGLPYHRLAAVIMKPFIGGAISDEDLFRITADTYGNDPERGFLHQAVAPLVQMDQSSWMMELFHGPTIAFKDYALQLLGRLFDHVLAARGQRITIVGATSGDTGSAAIEACRDRENLDIFILYPRGRVSEVQRRQMTTVASPNVHTIAVDGSFDDCQALVKAMFNDSAFRDAASLSAVNSINWARIMAQTVYYFAAGLALGAPDRRMAFSVPTGNFGNVYAGYAAMRMGLPVEKLIVGSNTNDILDRFFRSGAMETNSVVPTLSPSMDIQVSSNFERLLFDLHDRDGDLVVDDMELFRSTGRFNVGRTQMERAERLFTSERLDDEGILATIADIYQRTGHVIDPHTAVGVNAAMKTRVATGVPVVSLACAHPAKFPDAVERATGFRPALPPRLADLLDRKERSQTLPAELEALKSHIKQRGRVFG